jgi:hypothetical protein
MTARAFREMACAVVVCACPAMGRSEAQPGAIVFSRERVLESVNEAFATAARGDFVAARSDLERALASCGPSPERRECRVLYTSALGSLAQRQAAVNRRYRDSLYMDAVRYYDRILAEVPNEPEALYGKALAYRALGPHEWMEPFFTQAASLDPSRSGLYLTFKGDYFAAAGRWQDAAAAYDAATRQDPDDDGARSGLIDALSTLGPARKSELLKRARDWELRYPASSAVGYRAVLSLSFGPNAQRDATADSAIVGLVRVQSRNRLAVGAVPRDVSTDWTPVREMRDFQKSGTAESAPWWRETTDRTDALAQSALAGGRAATTAQNSQLAEGLWREGVRLSRQASAVSLDLQRELATLYTHQPRLDPDHRKFDALEQEIFAGKMGALAAGDLEAAQRYHTTLGLIYLERGVWKSQQYARNAEQQFTWALDKADERLERTGFYQPLPEIRVLLAHHFDSIGSKPTAARRYVEAARAFLDTDDLEGADSATRRAAALEADVSGPARVVRLRAELARGGGVATCSADRLAPLTGTGEASFVARQRFKILGDCAKIDTVRARRHAIEAFKLVDSVGITLVGGNDVARFERVMVTLLAPFGMTFRAEHLDQVPPRDGRPIRVTLPGETAPFAYTAIVDDVIGGRIVASLASNMRPFPMSVAGGVVSIPGTANVPPALIDQIRRVAGVRSVQFAPALRVQ